MYFSRLLFLFIGVAALIFLLVGLYKPWVMLWWEDTQNRKKVIKLYGAVALTGFTVYCILCFIGGIDA